MMLTVAQAAAQLNVERRLVTGLIQSGQLRASNIAGTGHGARYRIRQVDLDRFIEARTVAA